MTNADTYTISPIPNSLTYFPSSTRNSMVLMYVDQMPKASSSKNDLSRGTGPYTVHARHALTGECQKWHIPKLPEHLRTLCKPKCNPPPEETKVVVKPLSLLERLQITEEYDQHTSDQREIARLISEKNKLEQRIQQVEDFMHQTVSEASAEKSLLERLEVEKPEDYLPIKRSSDDTFEPIESVKTDKKITSKGRILRGQELQSQILDKVIQDLEPILQEINNYQQHPWSQGRQECYLILS